MSLNFVGTSLAGCAPYIGCNSQLAALARLLEKFNYGAYGFLQELFQAIALPSFWMHAAANPSGAWVLTTDDGYGWYAARMFVHQHGGFVLLIPWTGDREKRDGTMSDRLLQVHTFGNVAHSEIASSLQAMIAWLAEKDARRPLTSV